MARTPETLFSITRQLCTPAAGLHLWGTAHTYMVRDYQIDASSPITIGRDSKAQITINIPGDRTISGIHASLERLNETTMVIRDQGSTNGTYINGKLAVEPSPVFVGTCIRLGRKTRLVGVDQERLIPVCVRLFGEFAYLAYEMYGNWAEAGSRLDVEREFLRTRGNAWHHAQLHGE